MVFRHTRIVTGAPVGEVTVKAFDPTYYTDYDLNPVPAVQGPAGCTLDVEPADIGAAQRLWDQALALLTDDEVMNEDNLPLLGESFADTVVMSCG